MISPLGAFLRVLNATRTAINVALTGTSHTILRAEINAALLGDNAIIAAPGAGLRIYVHHLTLHNASAVTTTSILRSDATTINGTGFVLGTRAGYTFDAPGGPGMGEIALGVNEALVLNLSGANQHNGLVLYRTGA